MLFITLSVNHQPPFAIYAAHNTGKKRKGKTLYNVYRFNAETGKREKKIGKVGHYPEEGAETLTRIALELVPSPNEGE